MPKLSSCLEWFQHLKYSYSEAYEYQVIIILNTSNSNCYHYFNSYSFYYYIFPNYSLNTPRLYATFQLAKKVLMPQSTSFAFLLSAFIFDMETSVYSAYSILTQLCQLLFFILCLTFGFICLFTICFRLILQYLLLNHIWLGNFSVILSDFIA